MTKKLSIVVLGVSDPSEKYKDIEVEPATTVTDVLAQLDMRTFHLCRKGEEGNFLAGDFDLHTLDNGTVLEASKEGRFGL